MDRTTNSFTAEHDIEVVMVTVDRSPKRNYLRDTLQNLSRANVWSSSRLHGFQLFNSRSDPSWLGSVLDGAARHILLRSGHRTANANVAAALQAGAVSDARWVLFLEDDVDVCADFLDSVGRWLDDHASPAYRVYALGANYDFVSVAARSGCAYWRYPISCFYGTQGFVLKQIDAASLSAWLFEHEFARNPDGTAYDLLMHDWMSALWPDLKYFLATAPSFVQHIGRESVINPRDDVHSFPSWPGREWSYASAVRS